MSKATAEEDQHRVESSLIARMMTAVSCYGRECAYGLETGRGKMILQEATAVMLSTTDEVYVVK